MTLPLFIVDAFTSAPFAGNPAAVCLLDGPRDDAWLQAVASEMNLSETAFLLPEQNAWRLRWFTPRIEVDLCGHATLASAHTLWESGRLPSDAAALFETRSGRLTCVQRGAWIEMDFPSEAPADEMPPAALLDALAVGDNLVAAARNRFDWLVEVRDEAALRALSPDFRRLARVAVRGTIVTARSSDPQYDFVSRFFAPAAGIDEDPVTGSAHCCLGPYWGNKLHQTELVAFQASPRGGIVRMALRGNRVILSGQAVTTLRGALQ